MAKLRIYEIGNSRLNRSRLTGMKAGADAVLYLDENEELHTALFPALVSEEQRHRWGRLRMECGLSEECILSVWALAADERDIERILYTGQGGEKRRKKLFEQEGFLCGTNRTDMLLYDIQGKYLWIYLEVTGRGGGWISNIRIQGGGEQFLDTFPEIYREEGAFFHRYLSIFSSLYQDMQEEIEGAAGWLDLEKAPKQLLYLYAEWAGLKLDGDFLEEELLRKLVQNAYPLNRIKGTKQAILRLVELVLSRQAVIVERGLIQEKLTRNEIEVYDRLYGDSGQDITILIDGAGTEKIKSQLLFLLKQFKPVRSRLRLICYDNYSSRMDSYCYMDRNARLCRLREALLDGGPVLDACILL